MNLEDKLINAKKLMNMVDSGNYQRGNVNRSVLNKDPEELLQMYGGQVPQVQESAAPATKQNFVEPGTDQYVNKVNESRLPEHIKALMLENPIPTADVPMENTLDLEFTNRVAERMKKMDLIDNPKMTKGNIREEQYTRQPQPEPVYTRQPQPQPQYAPQNSGSVMGISEAALKELKPLIEHIVEASIEKILDKKLNEQESKTSKMNETLQIRVGDYIFTGKITGSKAVSKK